MSGGLPGVGQSAQAELGCLRLVLRATRGGEIRNPVNVALHAALHRLIERQEPAFAHQLHKTQIKPLSLSPLYRANGEVVAGPVAPGEELWAELALLEGTALRLIHGVLSGRAAAGGMLELEWIPMQLAQVGFAPPAGTNLPARAGYAALAAASAGEASASVRLAFLSPTLARSGGERLSLTPGRILGSLLRRWNAFAGSAALPLSLATINASVELTRADRWPVTMVVKRRELGVLGLAELQVAEDAPLRAAVAMLASYAAYCGTGSWTAYGLGRTRWLR